MQCWWKCIRRLVSFLNEGEIGTCIGRKRVLEPVSG